MPRTVVDSNGVEMPVMTDAEYLYFLDLHLGVINACVWKKEEPYCPKCDAPMYYREVRYFKIKAEDCPGNRIRLPHELVLDNPFVDLYLTELVPFCKKCDPEPKSFGPAIVELGSYFNRPH